MGLKKEDYADRGVADARAESAGDKKPFAMFDRADKCWQAVAYWDAFDAERDRIAAFNSRVRQVVATTRATYGADARPDDIRAECMAANTAGWPRAAAEHARLLALRVNARESDSERCLRSLHRLQKRHQRNQQKEQQA